MAGSTNLQYSPTYHLRTASTIYNSVGTRVIILTHGWIKQLSRCAAIPPGLISKVNHVVADNEGDREDSDEEYAVRQML